MKQIILTIASTIGAILFLFFKGKASGKKEVQAQHNEEVLKSVEQQKAIEKHNASLTRKQLISKLQSLSRKSRV